MASTAHCIYCFEVLAAELETRDRLTFREVNHLWTEYQQETQSTPTSTQAPIATATDEHPLFITWSSAKPNHRPRLRGCKGTFTAAPLADQLREFALVAALEDTRFRPVARSELQDLTCGVTILHSFRPIEDPLGWTVGKHGIRVAFEDAEGKKVYRATYLPYVVAEQGWTQEEALGRAARKAGWEGKLEGVKDLKVTTYEGWKEEFGYEEFAGWRRWLEEKRKS